MSGQIYQVITPIGLFNAEFGIDDEPITYTGDKIAISWFKEFLNQVSIRNQYGQSISFLNMSPEEMYYFCQPENSGIKVIPSFEDLAFYLNDNNDDDDMLDSVNDDLDTSGIVGWFDNTNTTPSLKQSVEVAGSGLDAFDILLSKFQQAETNELIPEDNQGRDEMPDVKPKNTRLDTVGKRGVVAWIDPNDFINFKEKSIYSELNKIPYGSINVGKESYGDNKGLYFINGIERIKLFIKNLNDDLDEIAEAFKDKQSQLGIQHDRALLKSLTPKKTALANQNQKAILDDIGQQPSIADKIKTSDSGLDAFDLLKDLLTESVAVNKKSMAHLYEYDDKRTRKQRIAANKAAEAILDKVKNENYQVTEDDKAILAKYSGNGGALEGADGMKGSQYEYYTPTPIAEGMWALMRELGFNGGKVLDPSSGTGIFGATSPSNAVIDSVELSEVSGMVQKLVNDNAFYTTTIAPFEKVAANNPDEIYDAVITNVPFGDTSARGDNFMHDTKYRKETLQGYFILRSLEKLKPRGLAAFIVPPSVVTGLDEKSISVRQRASMMAEFIGAYRLPNEVFGTAAADTMTDVIVFRKFSKEVAEKIAELREQSPQTLIDAKVEWDTFIDGKWYKGANERFILGEFKPKDPNAHHLSPEGRDRVTNNASMPELATMLKKFPKSRIDWDLLDSTETDPIIYKNGDTIVQSGQTLRYKNGTWEALPHNEDSVYIAQLLAKCDNPYAAFVAQIPWNEINDAVMFMRNTARGLEIPRWLSNTSSSIAKLGKSGEQGKYWDASVVALAMNQALEQHIGSVGFNYLEAYPELSTAIQQIAKLASKPDTRLTGNAKDALKSVRNHYDLKTGFSKFWQGQTTVLETKASDADSSFEGLMYQNRSKWINLDDAKAALGADFNEFENTDYCLSGDGKKLIKADDYYVGNLNDFLVKLDAEIEQAKGNDKLIGKLLNQRAEALKRVDTVDVSQMNFTLFSPFITVEEKLEFVKQFVNPNAMIVTNNKGQKVVDIEITGSKLSDDDKLAKRFGDYLMNRTLTVAGTKFDKYDNIGALRELRKMTVQANTNFDAWVKARPDIMARLNQQSSDAKSLRFRPVDDEAELTIAGMNPELKLHGYQCSFVRQKAREFSGINGFSVGLGKTFTALASVQYAQNMGVKNKTIFVVPNSVLSNWKKETARAYSTIDDCLFVGLRTDKNGNEKVNSSEYAVDLSRIMENQHKKIFMTYEAFQMIRLKDTSIEGFADYLRSNDASLEFTSDKKTDEKIKGYLALITSAVTDKKGNVPFLDDMGVDSIVIDEAHLLKNAAEANNFKSAKYLSLPSASKRAIDAQAKLWFIRGKSPLKDGVLLLTATPITNSPLEVFSMLTLSSGHEKLRDLCMGARGADDFMEMVCDKENEDDVSIDGIERTIDVFKGLNNVSILRNAIKNTTTIKNAEDVGDQIIVPDAETDVADLQLGDDIIDMLKQYKGAFRYAVDYMAEKKPNRGDYEAFVRTGAKFDLSVELLGHPFNLLKNMELLVMDKELDERATFFTFPKEQLALAKKVIEQFNGKKISADRPRLNPYTKNPDAVKGIKVKTDDVTGDVKEWYQIHVQAYLIDGDTRIVIDTMDTLQISEFEDLADKAGLTLDCTIPPKLAALLDNVSKELTNPRGLIKNGDSVESTPIVKQIIFCDILATHNKIRRLLTKKCGIPAGKIATVTGKTNNEADAILEVQNGFNANGEDNKYQIILANEKAEVGINLQIGTQAIHHLTIGWTPDSLTQRNGRGQRQGNQTKKVNIYYYDADGTFDKQKRAMVERKGDWINDLMSNQSTNKIEVTGGMSREQMEVLMESVGDKDAMARYQDMLQAKEAEARAKTNRDKQLINLTTINKQREWLNVNPTAEKAIKSALNDLNNLFLAKWKIEARKATTATAEAKNQAAIAEFDTAIEALASKIDNSCTIYKTDYSGNLDSHYPNGVSAIMVINNFKSWVYKAKTILEAMQGGYGTYFKFDLINDGPIVTQWQNNKTLAENMIESSVKNFENQATEKGALPSVVARAIADGKGLLMNGKPVIVGNLLTRKFDKETAYIIVESIVKDYAKIVILGRDSFYELRSTTIDDHEIAMQGTPEYDKLAKEIAKIEDDKYSTAGIDIKLLSDYSVDIANYRTKKQKVSVNSTWYRLPPPYFPIVITDKYAKTPLIQKIAESQKSIVEKINDYHFVVDKSVNVTDSKNNYNLDIFVPELMRYAKAHGLTIGLDDLIMAGSEGIAISFSTFDEISKSYFDKSSVISEIKDKALALDPKTFTKSYIGDDIHAFVKDEVRKEFAGFLSDELIEKFIQGNYFYTAISMPVIEEFEKRRREQAAKFAKDIEALLPAIREIAVREMTGASEHSINGVVDSVKKAMINHRKDIEFMGKLVTIYAKEKTDKIVSDVTKLLTEQGLLDV